MSKRKKTKYHFMPNDEYAFLVRQLCDNSDEDRLASIVWTLAESGAIFPEAVKDQINSELPPPSPTWGIDFIKKLDVNNRSDDLASPFEAIFSDIAAELDNIIECFGRFEPPFDAPRIGQADNDRVMSANQAA